MKLQGPPWEVIHCVFSVAIGGQELVILSLAEHTDKALFAPRVLCLQSAGELAPRFEALGIAVDVLEHPVGTASSVSSLAAMHRYLRERRPAIVHTHNPIPHQYGAITHITAGVPVLVHTKHGRNNLPTAKGRWLERFAGRMTDTLVAVSADAAEVARTFERVPADRVRVIRNGVNLREIVPMRRPRGGWRVVHVARLNQVKNQDTLLRAARIVLDHEPTFRLAIVGDGELRAELEQLAVELQLGDAVSFQGFHRDIRPFLADADAFVLSSVSEGIALTLLEAMASGLPVVATDVGGNREVVVAGKTGYLVPPSDPVALARAIIELLGNPDRVERFGAAARARMEAEFSLDVTVTAYHALYRELLTPHVPRRSFG